MIFYALHCTPSASLTIFSQRLCHRLVDSCQHVCVDDVKHWGHVEQSLRQQRVPVFVELLDLGLPPVETKHTQYHQPCRRRRDEAGDVRTEAGSRRGFALLKSRSYFFTFTWCLFVQQPFGKRYLVYLGIKVSNLKNCNQRFYLERVPPLAQTPEPYAGPSAIQERAAPRDPSLGWPRGRRGSQAGALRSARRGAASPSDRTARSSDASTARWTRWTRACWTPPGSCDRRQFVQSHLQHLWPLTLRRTPPSPSQPHLRREELCHFQLHAAHWIRTGLDYTTADQPEWLVSLLPSSVKGPVCTI